MRVQAATVDIKFFERLVPHQHRELCRVMTYSYVPKGVNVFSQGDIGTTFYVIYRGAAKVYVKEALTDPPPTSILPLPPSKQLGTCVCVLEDGDSFGELALMGNGIRNATVMTAMPTILFKVEKDAYEGSLQKLHESDLQTRMDFLEGVFVFSDWPQHDLRKIAYVVTPRRYEKNTCIIKQGESSDAMYFLFEGTCRVLQTMPLSSRQHQMLGGRGAGSGQQVLDIGTLTKHQYFGERALLDKGEHTACVVAITPASAPFPPVPAARARTERVGTRRR